MLQASVGTPISSILGLAQLARAFPRVGIFMRREEARKARGADIVESEILGNFMDIGKIHGQFIWLN